MFYEPLSVSVIWSVFTLNEITVVVLVSPVKECLQKSVKTILLSRGELRTLGGEELAGVINGLRALKRPCKVTIYSDSAYVVNAFNQNWLAKWMTNGWKNSAKAEVANADLWKELAVLTATHQVTFSKVKGHADDELNNRCDELAVAESRKFK